MEYEGSLSVRVYLLRFDWYDLSVQIKYPIGFRVEQLNQIEKVNNSHVYNRTPCRMAALDEQSILRPVHRMLFWVFREIDIHITDRSRMSKYLQTISWAWISVALGERKKIYIFLQHSSAQPVEHVHFELFGEVSRLNYHLPGKLSPVPVHYP